MISGQAVILQCDHKYDIDCLEQLFTFCIFEESRLPSCCGRTIEVSELEGLLDEDVLASFRETHRELSTTNRVYCANKDCGEFLGPRGSVDLDSVECPKCGDFTCPSCSGPAHSSGSECATRQEEQMVVNVGREHGWRQCPGCQAMVERAGGCMLMRCTCGTSFCYSCAAVRTQRYGCQCGASAGHAAFDMNRIYPRSRTRPSGDGDSSEEEW